MYVAVIPNRRSPPAILLRESFRENGKTKPNLPVFCKTGKTPGKGRQFRRFEIRQQGQSALASRKYQTLGPSEARLHFLDSQRRPSRIQRNA